MTDIIALIHEKETDFSKSQKKIADYIASNIEKAAYMTASRLSEKAAEGEDS